LDGPLNEWQEGPGLIESIRRYKWLIVTAALIGAVVAGAWSSRQPIRYEGVVRVFLDIRDDRTVDPGRIVNSQAQYLTSPVVLDRAVDLIGHRLSRAELSERLTVEPSEDANSITVRVLDATPKQAAGLADTVVRAYREVVAKQTAEAARRDVASLERRQQQLEREIVALDEQRRAQPGNVRLQAIREAKDKELHALADQVEEIRRDAVRSARSSETVREKAPIPDEPTQPKPKQAAAIGAVLAAVAAAALAWWLYGRVYTPRRQRFPGRALAGAAEEDRAGVELGSPLRMASRFRDGQAASADGAPATDGTTSGIADFDQIATSVQELSRFLEGPTQRLYEEDLPQLAAEEIAHRFQVDLAAILLDNAGEVQTMGSVGLRAGPTSSTDRGVRHLIEAAARSGPRLVEPDELVRLASTGLGGDQADSLALVPLVRDEVGFGVLVAGRRRTDERVAPLSEREVQEIADCTRDIVPYLWAWLLLRVLKLRLRTLQ
jgi:uncharacterized protein involved in exopolysaccharide biosynthesis